MWPNNGFGGNGHFQGSFNQDTFQQPGFGAGPDPRFFPQQPNMLPFQVQDDSNNNGGFQPEVGSFNNGSYMQNQAMSPFSPTPFIPPQTMTLVQRPPSTQINARAAELKAKLLKNREDRNNSVTPNRMAHTELTDPMRGSPKTPAAAAEKHEQELNVNELISQYSESRPGADASVKQEKLPTNSSVANVPRIQRQEPSSKPHTPALEKQIDIKALQPNMDNGLANLTKGKAIVSRHASHASDVSEGEILEDIIPEKLAPPTEPKELQMKRPTRNDEFANRKARDDQADAPYTRLPRPDVLSRSSPVNGKTPRIRDERRDEPEQRGYFGDYTGDRRPQPYQRRDSRDNDYRRKDSLNDQRNAEPSRQQRPPTLNDLLATDENLREWLEITGYHNAPYRDKILDRRRAIAALDAQRQRLVAEMQAEERPVLQAGLQDASMLPPPLPDKPGGQADGLFNSISSGEIARDRVVSNKRPYSDIQSPREDPTLGKFARTDDRSHGPRFKEEDNDRRPRSNGFDSSRRSTLDHRERDERSPKFDAGELSRERDTSPNRRPYDGRPTVRNRSYESDIRDDNSEYDPRPYEVRGNYRGRGFDPNYRGRGRGRGRGGDSRGGHRESREGEPAFGSRITNGGPYKDPKGFERGGKGDTRYFIVKSFNEDNVLKCIKDSIWTTQAQNGPIFKEAFETCKNVILFFSINKSRAFQGYARMESLPGSIPIPDWQKSIQWESAGAFKVRWLLICSTAFEKVGFLRNGLNGGLPVLIGKDGQEVEGGCAEGLVEVMGEVVERDLERCREGGRGKG